MKVIYVLRKHKENSQLGNPRGSVYHLWSYHHFALKLCVALTTRPLTNVRHLLEDTKVIPNGLSSWFNTLQVKPEKRERRKIR